MGMRYAVVRRGWYLSTMWIRVGVGHVGRHVAVVLVVSACPTPLLVHVGVVCVWWWHRVEMVGGVVCSGSLTRAWSAVGR